MFCFPYEGLILWSVFGPAKGGGREGGGGCRSPSLSEEIEGFLFNRLVKRLFSLRTSSRVKGIANLYFLGETNKVCV